MRRIITFFLCLILSFYILPTYAANQTVFIDVKPTDWFYQDVMDCYSKGLLSGYGGKFGVNDNITFAQFIKCMVTVKWPGENRPQKEGEPWQIAYMELAVQKGLLAEGEIKNYDAPIPREKIAVYMCKALGIEPDNGEVVFPDTAGKPEAGYINTMYKEYLTEGGSNGLYGYNATVTRAQLASFTIRAYNYNINSIMYKTEKASQRKAAISNNPTISLTTDTIKRLQSYPFPENMTEDFSAMSKEPKFTEWIFRSFFGELIIFDDNENFFTNEQLIYLTDNGYSIRGIYQVIKENGDVEECDYEFLLYLGGGIGNAIGLRLLRKLN